MKRSQADQDSPWKEILERYFEAFVVFFFPHAHREIDWRRKHEFLDKELQKITRDAALGRRLADKLVKVRLIDGAEAWVLMHIEIQGQKDANFAQRMYVYNYRIFDRYGRRVASLAILADNRQVWRPSEYNCELLGCWTRFHFPAVKLLDYAGNWRKLEKDRNPFSIVVMAHLKCIETKRDAAGRLRWKLELVRMLYERGYEKSDILELFRFIDWIMVLPEELEKDFSREHEKYEEAAKMPYVTSVERLGIKKGIHLGIRQGIQQGIQRGVRQGVRQGRQKGETELVLRQIKRRLGTVPVSQEKTIRRLTLSQIEALGEALLDFGSRADLSRWLRAPAE